MSEEDAAARAERTARRRARVRRRRRIVLGIGSGVVVLVLAAVLWFELVSHALGPAGKAEVIQVRPGESFGSVLSDLGSHHVVGSTFAFKVDDILHGTPAVQPGYYELHQNQTFGEVRSILGAGPNVNEVDVRPGFTLSEVATQVDGLPGHASGSFTRVAASGVVQSTLAAAGSDNLEGLLGTGTYLVRPGESDATLLAAMVQRLEQQATAAGLSTASATALGMTPYEVVTAASIVEKEGYIAKNMPQVARVIYNRLAHGTPLQMNATVLYSLGQDGGTVTSQDLQLPTPYNTYLHTGLTPTPICSPSPTALHAAVHPPAGQWLYFVVVKKDGTEAFADTFAEQLANEKLAQERGAP
jgi:UPF0755 protein